MLRVTFDPLETFQAFACCAANVPTKIKTHAARERKDLATMALLKATYESLELVPEWARQLYKQNSAGKWEIQHNEIEGIAELSNPGLAANRDRFASEKESAERRAAEAERLRGEAERQLNSVRSPGSVVLSADDAKAWQGFTTLGDLKTVKKIVEEYPTLKRSVELAGQETLWREAAGDLALNFDALKDQLTHPQRGDGLAITRKQVDVDDPATGTKVKKFMPFVVKREKVEGGGFKETETPLLDYAVNNWPAYAVAAMQAGDQSAQQGAAGDEYSAGAFGSQLMQPSTGGAPAAGTFQGGGASPQTGVRMPVLGTAAQTTQGGTHKAGAVDTSKLIEGFNNARNTRPSPFGNAGGNSAAAGTNKT